MKGYIFVSPGSDPGAGKPLADPLFGKLTTMGACRPDLRRLVRPGDHLFVVSGSGEGVPQYIIGGFEIEEKIDALAAYERFPGLRLRLENGVKLGNIIVDEKGEHHNLDHHDKFEKRIENYIVGRDALYLHTPPEIALGRDRSLEILKGIYDKKEARHVREIIGRSSRLDEAQIEILIQALETIKAESKDVRPR